MAGLLIWDFDGTLARRRGMWSGALAELASEHGDGWEFTTDDFKPHLQGGFPWHDWQTVRELAGADQWWEAMEPLLQSAFSKGGGFEEREAALLASRVRARYLRPEAWELFDDVLPFFAGTVARQYRHVILSNHVPELPEILAGLGIAGFFESVFNSALTGIEKPHPEAFLQVLRAYPDVERRFMIGDSQASDIEGAEAAGIPGILVRSSDTSASQCCPSLLDLEQVLGCYAD